MAHTQSPSPIDSASALHQAGDDFALLLSSLSTSYSGTRSLLASGVAERITGDDFAALRHALPHGQWFGWLGYGLRHATESLPSDTPSIIDLPALCMTRFEEVEESRHCDHQPTSPPRHDRFVTSLASTMTRAEYLAKVATTIEQIRAGRFYQANITRKFYGTLTEGFCPSQIFARLCRVSPAPYSAWLRMGDTHILSSSPELFLRITQDGTMTTRPIKGSAGKDTAPEALQQSPKDRAENLMIADLMRNDFSRVAVGGSVRVSELFGVDSFPTIHHLSSTVEARLAPSHNVLDAITACFPPGSMTGAPKIAAMRWCSEMEGIERGVYSGALGWIAPDSCELSVVIRTLVIQGNRFEFQVGGGIVVDSDPESEWRETLTKARGIAAALGIEQDALAAL